VIEFITALVNFLKTLPAHIIEAAHWTWDHRWWIPVAVLVLGAVSCWLTFVNRRDRQVRDAWRKRY
jgi:hypothetical protein